MKKKCRRNRRKLNNFQLVCGAIGLLMVVASQIFCMILGIIAIIKMLFFEEIRIEFLILCVVGLTLMVTIWLLTTGKVVHPIIYAIVMGVRSRIFSQNNNVQYSDLETESELNDEHNNDP
jgi:hypothetical protein